MLCFSPAEERLERNLKKAEAEEVEPKEAVEVGRRKRRRKRVQASR